MTDAVGQLEYAKAPRWHRRRGVRRVILLAALVVCAVASVRWFEAAWGHAKLMYWQRKCLAYAAPSGTTVDQSAGRGVKAWQEFYALLSPPGRKAAPLVFLGEMRRKDGGRRFVAIEEEQVQAARGNARRGLALDYHVIVPGGAWSRPRLVKNDVWFSPEGQAVVKIHPAVIDPNDPSHVTIAVEPGYSGATGVIDGWLQADDSLLLEVRRGESSESARR